MLHVIMPGTELKLFIRISPGLFHRYNTFTHNKFNIILFIIISTYAHESTVYVIYNHEVHVILHGIPLHTASLTSTCNA